MFRALVILASLLGVSAFVPVSNRAPTSALKMADFSKEIGAQMPLGFWDPLGLMKDADQATFDLYRYYPYEDIFKIIVFEYAELTRDFL